MNSPFTSQGFLLQPGLSQHMALAAHTCGGMELGAFPVGMLPGKAGLEQTGQSKRIKIGFY